MPERRAIPLGHARWLKIIIVLALLIPPVVAHSFQWGDTAQVIKEILAAPLLNAFPALLVVAKYALLLVSICCLLRPEWIRRVGLAYYAVILAVVAFGQNMALTPRHGFAWALGNTVVQLIVAGTVAADVLGGRTQPSAEQLRPRRLWVLFPMAIAWLFPYLHVGDQARAGVPLASLWNESGLTYCMITPVILGILILFSDGVYHPTMAVAAWVGLLFGIINALTWFVINPHSWWMGVLHLPLLVLSAYALWLSRRRRSRL